MTKICDVYQFGPFKLDTGEYRLLRDGVEIPLQMKAFETLRLLVERAGRLLTKEELLCQVWPGTTVEENNLNKNISLLRKVLGECADGQSYIETVPRVGYRFAPVVQTVTSVASPTPDNHVATDSPPQKSVAVLYFENLSGAKEDEYF